MADQYLVFNRTKGFVSFKLYPPVDPASIASLASHRVRRIVRSSAVSVMIPPSDSVDLVKLTGLPVDQIGNCSVDLLKLQSRGALEVSIITTEDAPPEPEPMKPAFIMLEKIQEVIQEKPAEKVADDTKPVIKRRGRPKKTQG